MTVIERREGGKRLCRRLAADVAAITPPEVGSWDRAWELVSDSSAEFMVALTRWEATGADEDKPALRAAYYSVIEAWRQAVEEFHRERAGR